MQDEQEVRYLIETNIGTFSVYGYTTNEDVISFTEGDGEIHQIPKKEVLRVIKETIQKQDITQEVIAKEVALLV